MEKISNKTLGIAGIIAAPFLGFELLVNGKGYTSLGGVFDLIYMLGWMCSLIGLLRLQATGTDKAGKVILYIQMGLLTIANIWNIWEIIDPKTESQLFFILDFSWPASNGFMLITGIFVALKSKFIGWRRWTVLFAGCWLPCLFLMMKLASNDVYLSFIISYSILAWGLVGLTVATTPKPNGLYGKDMQVAN